MKRLSLVATVDRGSYPVRSWSRHLTRYLLATAWRFIALCTVQRANSLSHQGAFCVLCVTLGHYNCDVVWVSETRGESRLSFTGEQKKKGTNVISATMFSVSFSLLSPQVLGESPMIEHGVEMSVFTIVARSRLLIMRGYGSGFTRLIEHSPCFRLINSPIHQNPTKRLSHWCYDPAKPSWETRRTRIDSDVFCFPIEVVT